MPQINKDIFRAYDIRGIVKDNELSKENIFYIGQAIATIAQNKGIKEIAVGRDGRLSSLELTSSLIAGLNKGGINVVDIDLVATPMLYYAAHILDSKSGIMVTGSHNPGNYNGLKMVLAGNTLAEENIQEISQIIESEKFANGEGIVKSHNIENAYLQEITNRINLNHKKPKVVIDCGNGATSLIAPKLFSYLGCEVIPLFAEIDGRFPNHHPDPSDPKNMRDLINKVKEHNADIGLAFDGDGDRLGVVSAKGEIIWPDRIIMLFVKDILAQYPNSEIIFDVKCSRLLPQFIEQLEGKTLMWKTGHSLIKAKLKETNAAFAGEMSGHFFFNYGWFGFDDALYAGAKLVAMITFSNKGVLSELPNSINTPELKIAVSECKKQEIMQSLITMADFPGGKINTLDGLRVDFPYGFGLVRASNTTPCLVCRFEGDNEENLSAIKDNFRNLVNSIIPNITLPF